MNANDTIRGDTYRVRYQLPGRTSAWDLVGRLTRKPPGGGDRIDQPTDEFTLVGWLVGLGRRRQAASTPTSSRLTRKPPGGVDRIDQPTDEFTLVGTPAFGAVILQRSWITAIETHATGDGAAVEAQAVANERRAP